MVGEPLKAIACLVAACCISWQLTLVFVLLVPLAGYILVRVSKMMRRAAKKVLEQMSAMYKIVRETFDSIRVGEGVHARAARAAEVPRGQPRVPPQGDADDLHRRRDRPDRRGAARRGGRAWRWRPGRTSSSPATRTSAASG